MSTVPFLLKGLGIGLALAAPVGPMSILCIRRTLRDGPLAGIVSGLGIASADAAYGAIAAFGISAVASVLLDLEMALRLIGGLFLLALGARILFKDPAPEVESAGNSKSRFAGAFISCFFLTMTNPTTILTFVAIFAGFGLVGHSDDYIGATSLVVGVFVGSTLWWLALCGSVSLLRRRMGPAPMTWINRASGIVIAAFGIGILAAAI
ncbi:MAG: LysE family translocator [Alphaproteobacteria bacterium]